MTGKRKYKRFAVSGKAVLETPAGYLAGEITNLAAGGMLLHSDADLPIGQKIAIHFTIDGFPHSLAAEVLVVRAEPGFLGVQFVREVPGLLRVLFGLECPAVASLV